MKREALRWIDAEQSGGALSKSVGTVLPPEMLLRPMREEISAPASRSSRAPAERSASASARFVRQGEAAANVTHVLLRATSDPRMPCVGPRSVGCRELGMRGGGAALRQGPPGLFWGECGT